MYTVVMLAALTTAEQAPSGGFHKSYNYGTCYGPCYGYCYSGWDGSVNAAGCWGMPYGGYWAGYAGWGGCGGYQSAAYGLQMPSVVTPAPVPYYPYEPKKDRRMDDDSDDDKKSDDDRKMDEGDKKPIQKKAPDKKTPLKPKDLDDDDVQVRAKVIFRIPDNAKLFVDDQPVSVDESRTTFRTPQLRKGEKYFYDLRVEVIREGRNQVENRRITLSAGDVIRADFTGDTEKNVANSRGR